MFLLLVICYALLYRVTRLFITLENFLHVCYLFMYVCGIYLRTWFQIIFPYVAPSETKDLTLGNKTTCNIYQDFPVSQTVTNLPAMQETRVWSLGWEDPLEKGMASQSSILAWRIPWIEEPGELKSVGLQMVEHDWATNIHDIYHPCQLNHNQDIFLFLHQCKIYYANFFCCCCQLSDGQCL